MQINYHENFQCFASNEKLIGISELLSVSVRSAKIRKGSDFSQPLPYNLTMYSEVKSLLPNHYLNLSQNTVSRYFPLKGINQNISTKEILDLSIQRVSNIVKEYSKDYDLICPLTAGTDSRLNLAFLKNYNKDVLTYTFYHKGFNENTSDILIPKKISQEFNIKHDILYDLEAPTQFNNYIEEYCGNWHSQYTINLAFTLSEYLKPNSAIINGDIIDQIGKSLIGNSVPDIFANKSFLNCKVHNTTKESKEEISKWLLSLKHSDNYNISKFDLFAWENRLGRWASQGNMLYSCLSISTLNIYNCRDIILLWLNIPRKKRKELSIHLPIFENLDPQLLDFPFNPTNKMINLLKKNWVTFLVATYGKSVYKRLFS